MTSEQRAQWKREIAERETRQREEQKAESERKQSLCRMAAACKKYSEARLECATAGNFKTCLHIKMATDASYSGICSGFDEGAPAVPLPQETPNWFECLFLQ